MRNSWSKKVLKIHKSMAYMEQSKYLDPHISFSFDELAGILRNNVSCTDSTRMSNISGFDKITSRGFNIKSLPNTPSNAK